MRLAAILLLALPAFGQFTITASRQDSVIPKAYIGASIPTTLALYLVTTYNDGQAAASIYVDRVAAEIAKQVPVQDGAAVKYAAQHFKKGRWKVIALNGVLFAIPIGGSALASVKAATTVSKVVASVGGGAGLAAIVTARRDDLQHLEVPVNFWQPDPMNQKTLEPGQTFSMLLVLGGAKLDPIIPASIAVAPARVSMLDLPASATLAAGLRLYVEPAPIKTVAMIANLPSLRTQYDAGSITFGDYAKAVEREVERQHCVGVCQ